MTTSIIVPPSFSRRGLNDWKGSAMEITWHSLVVILLGSFSIRVGGSERVQIQFFAKYLRKYVYIYAEISRGIVLRIQAFEQYNG